MYKPLALSAPAAFINDVLFVLLCLANQTGVNLQQAFDKKLELKTERDRDRHHNNPKLKS